MVSEPVLEFGTPRVGVQQVGTGKGSRSRAPLGVRPRFGPPREPRTAAPSPKRSAYLFFGPSCVFLKCLGDEGSFTLCHFAFPCWSRRSGPQIHAIWHANRLTTMPDEKPKAKAQSPSTQQPVDTWRTPAVLAGTQRRLSRKMGETDKNATATCMQPARLSGRPGCLSERI